MKVMTANDIIESTGLVVMIYGDPGVGKTTLANTSPNPIVLDFDRGSHRASLHKNVVQFDSWADVLQYKKDLDVLIEKSDTIVVDTVGTLLDSINTHLIETQPMLAKNSIKLWGELKKSFQEFFTPLRAKNKNIIFIAHAKEKEEGDIRIKRPLIQGSSYDLLMQSCDLIGYYGMKNNVRTLSFDISDSIVAKNCAGLPPIQIRSVETMEDLFKLILLDTKNALSNRNAQQQRALQSVAIWRDKAESLIAGGDCTIADISDFMDALKAESTNFPKGTSAAVWATVKSIFETSNYLWNAESGKFEETQNG